MTKEMVLGIIRHSLTFIGGALVVKGVVDEGASQEIIGALVTLIGTLWSVFQKKSTPAG